MNSTLLSSSLVINHAQYENWYTPARIKVRLLQKLRHSYSQISNATGLARSTIQGIIKAKSSRRSRKGKEYKLKLITPREFRRITRYIATNWASRLTALTTTIKCALRAARY